MARSPARHRLVRILKLALGVAVILGVGRHVVTTLDRLRRSGEPIAVDPAWMALAVGLYLAGLVLFGLWYWRILAHSSAPIGPLAAVRAYVISHLGKYTPGKALVVVLRAGLGVPAGGRPATAAFATLYETLTMMAAGGLMAAGLFLTAPVRTLELAVPGVGPVPVPLPWLSLGLGLGFLVLVTPPVFRRLAGAMSLPFPNVGADALPRFGPALLAEGLAWSLAGWVCWGLSQVAVLRALGMPVTLIPAAGPPGSLAGGVPVALAMGSAALATLAGFVVLLTPGGLGVRELVLWTALGAAVPHSRAVLAALALRLAWLAGEVLGALVLAPLRPGRSKPPAAPPDPTLGAGSGLP